ncbi:MAG TPA: tripartite tricarboxylate transporter substrate binding protein [Burkholderiales bacterium]|nr:tripartite tricarboxylate transporter substrate binding protein [Burkholderiales bacterium]
MKTSALSLVYRVVPAFALAGVVASPAHAQQYPSKPVRVVIVFAPGGATDVVGRLVFNKVGEQLGQQFLADNRAGASGTIGGAIVAKSPPDGYTVMVYSTTLLASAHIYKRLPYNAMTDFTGITPVARLVLMLAVHPSMPVHNVKDLIALAKARPDEISYGTAGVGALQHLATSLFVNETGIKLNHVPYKGGAPASAALASGEIQMIITPASEAAPHVQSKRIRAVAVTSAQRTTQFPDVPAIGETVKGFDFTSWMGTFAPAGTPRPILEKLNAEIKKAVADRDVASKLSALTLDPMHMSLEDFAALLKTENVKYQRIVKLSGASIE